MLYISYEKMIEHNYVYHMKALFVRIVFCLVLVIMIYLLAMQLAIWWHLPIISSSIQLYTKSIYCTVAMGMHYVMCILNAMLVVYWKVLFQPHASCLRHAHISIKPSFIIHSYFVPWPCVVHNQDIILAIYKMWHYEIQPNYNTWNTTRFCFKWHIQLQGIQLQ